MRRIIAIALIALMLLNAWGFYGVLVGIQFHQKQALHNRVDAGDLNALTTTIIKMPVAVPYAADQEDYQRVDGDFEYQGEFYRMVGQKFAQDTLYVMCVQDRDGGRIHQALTDYVKTFSDDDGQPSGKVVVSLIKDYLPAPFDISSVTSGWQKNVAHSSPSVYFYSSYFFAIVHPPERG